MSAKAKYLRWADAAARQYGIPPGILKALISHESAWRPDAVSPAGAVGLGQFMPDTARGLGINPRNPRQAIFGAAKYLSSQIRAFGGDLRLGLAAYNAGAGAVKKYGGIPPYAETQRYVKNIMRDAGHYHSSAGASIPEEPGTPGMTIETPNAPDLGGVALANLSSMAEHGGHFDPLEGLGNLVAAIQSAGSTTAHVAGQAPAEQPQEPGGPWQKYVRLAGGADRKGVSTQAPVKRFVGELGARLGRPLTITTGTRHNEYTVNGRVSAHWSGHAADIAMSGKALTRAGRQALILAGMSPAQARKVKGGLFNIGGYQIIFNTREGGNHWNHLHVGIRR